jgi:hypothetical protein
MVFSEPLQSLTHCDTDTDRISLINQSLLVTANPSLEIDNVDFKQLFYPEGVGSGAI